jgi:hypothetical protein
MKYTDDYSAKLKIWAEEGKVHPIPRIANLPRFGSKKFSSHEEMNAWKKALLAELVESGGAEWTS